MRSSGHSRSPSGFRAVAVGFLALTLFAATSAAAVQAGSSPSNQLLVNARTAYTWTDDAGRDRRQNIVLLEGPVTIELELARLTADQAVIWIARDPDAAGTPGNQQRVEIALVGNAQVDQDDVQRGGDRLLVTATVRGPIRVTAVDRIARNRSDSALYRRAATVRAGARRPVEPAVPVEPPVEPPVRPPPDEPGEVRPPVDIDTGRPPRQPRPPETSPTTGPIAPVAPAPAPVVFSAPDVEVADTGDGTVSVVLSRGVTLFQRRENGDLIELQADRVVLFTPLASVKDVASGPEIRRIQDAVTAAYLEGDVRITFTPAAAIGGGAGEQRLRAKRVYYEFASDRAVLTDAVIHTTEPTRNMPVIIRARNIRQLSQGEYRADKVKLSTSAFATPSYSINADRIYIRQSDTGDPRLGMRTLFRANNATVRAFDLPFFYWPYVGGSMTDRGMALRGLGVENSSSKGFGLKTEWGLFESLGQIPPDGLDAAYRLDYFAERGPAAGLDVDYAGGFVTEADKERWAFKGDFTAYGIYDEGETDDFGRGAIEFSEDAQFRGRARYQHQHFFPGDYQVQFRAGVVSDPTFLEEWFERDFDESLPHDVSLYVKRQRDDEAYTALVQAQPSDLVTTSDQLQEQFEVERLPGELTYRRLGATFGRSPVTVFSENRIGGFTFNPTRASLDRQGFRGGLTPGIPALGFTGIEDNPTYRGDFRQELNYPIAAGPLKFIPYAVGRYTGYSDSPDGGSENRLFGAVGARLTTSFWRTDDSVRSKLFDLNRMRHVIEPEVNVFTSASTRDRNDVFIYETDVDAIHDVSAAQIALRQRWQTKRGGPGRWRSVDFFTLNLEANFFANQPDEEELDPRGFRGLYFASLPETSVPRNSFNADAAWRISDNTVIIADAQQNLDEGLLATAAVGVLVRRDERLTYFLGNRYIEDLDSNITTFFTNYELTRKYSLALSQNFDFGRGENVSSNLALIRKFDRFFAILQFSYDATNDQGGVTFNVYPTGLGYGIDTNQLNSAFRRGRD